MDDVFLEEMVKRRNGPKEIAMKTAIYVAGVLVSTIALTFIASSFFGPFALLVSVGAIYFAWFFGGSLNMEFEYIYTNGEIDFDKISAKRKRKRMLTIKISSFDEFDVFDKSKYDPSKYEVKYDASISLLDPSTHYATFRNKEGKSCILFFNPGERLLKAIHACGKRKNYGR